MNPNIWQGRKPCYYDCIPFDQDVPVYGPGAQHPMFEFEQSPIYGLNHSDLFNANAEFLILLSGIDETFSQTVHTRSSYKADEVVWNARFADIYNHASDTETLTIDVRRLDLIERIEP